MKNYIRAILLPMLLISVSAGAQILRPFTARYYNPSARGGIVYVANSIITKNGVSSGVPGTGEIAPTGTSTNNGAVAVNLDIDGPFPTTIIPLGSSWKYRDNNITYTNWQTFGYNDATWPTANAEFGYGQGDETTCVASGGTGTVCMPGGTKYITTYFRKTINVADPTLYSSFTFNVFRDDGVVVYLNGNEVYRNNMPAGVIVRTTLASSAASDEGDAAQSFTLPISSFLTGTNRIAVEVHQTSATSSDVSFDLELVGNPISSTTIIPAGSNWKYLADNTRPANWNTVAYSDAAWPSGNGQFGYGDGDETTCVPSGGAGTLCVPTGDKYITTYFRKTINIPNPSIYTFFIMKIKRDDGAVVYFNGNEVFRDNLPAGPMLHSTLAIDAASDDGNEWLNIILPTSSMIAGNNQISVEMHQNGITSSDLSFDMQLDGSTDPTFNTTSADLNLPDCSNILFAGLYWGAGQGASGSNTGWIQNETTVQLRLPGAPGFTTLTSSQTDYWNNTLIPGYVHTGYQCFRDITSLMNTTNPNGTYTIANMASPAGQEDAYGGWTIVIVYGNPSLLPRNLTVFDGNAGVKSGSGNVDVNISGFLTPPGGPVSCELGAVVYDGDRGSPDAFSFKQASSGTYYDLTPTVNNPTSNLNDMWNSVIAYKGNVVTTRNPAFQNTLGYDANIIELPNAANAQLSNSQNAATVRFSSPNENYIVTVLTTAISQYNPTFSFSKTATDINGAVMRPGDSIQYQMNYTNVGNDASIANVITDNIPAGTSYLRNSLRINGVLKTDAAGDDEAEYDLANNRVRFRLGTGANATNGGTMATGASGNVQFRVVTGTSCMLYACGSSIRNTGSINYMGQTSGAALYDSSGVSSSGCITPGPSIVTPVANCTNPPDTLIVNRCPANSLMIPWMRYAGYQIYSAQPFTAANVYNPLTPVTATRVYWAYFNSGSGCSDTVRINMVITACPDIDDDNDGIPDYVEFNDIRALQDANSNGVPNWNDATYAGYVNNNADNVNDNFDWGADSDNDGIPNFMDTNFWIAFVDTNGDGVNDRSDMDLDGIPNQFDLDSDNDGIPDVAESAGVDANGDGRIDNYTDTDNDGFSQNVDSSNTGVNGSRTGLTALDYDRDGIPNYLDRDSDNDGVPDVIEVGGADSNNDGIIDSYVDTDGDGLSDLVDGDVGNDGVAENSANAILRTGPDVSPVNGRADSYPYKNFDNDSKPDVYDIDSDMDGITDVVEAGFVHAFTNGAINAPYGTDGWSTLVNTQASLGLRNTDGRGNPDYIDIDADDDGIPDNVEGMTTLGYIMPTFADGDGDGLDNAYDNLLSTFGGRGVFLSDNDLDGIPDYIDLDTDSDGRPDIIEGNDFNLNTWMDDNVTLTLLDTDGDGLDNRFDSLTSVTNRRGTSYRMGTGGTFTGDPNPGSRTTVQRSTVMQSDRDWRSVGYVLYAQKFELLAKLNGNSSSSLTWDILSPVNVSGFEVERSTDNVNFSRVAIIPQSAAANEQRSFSTTDDIRNLSPGNIYYRIKMIAANGMVQISNVASVKLTGAAMQASIFPNPANDIYSLRFYAEHAGTVVIKVIDKLGHVISSREANVVKGMNDIKSGSSKLASGIYIVQIINDESSIVLKLNVQHAK